MLFSVCFAKMLKTRGDSSGGILTTCRPISLIILLCGLCDFGLCFHCLLSWRRAWNHSHISLCVLAKYSASRWR